MKKNPGSIKKAFLLIRGLFFACCFSSSALILYVIESQALINKFIDK